MSESTKTPTEADRQLITESLKDYKAVDRLGELLVTNIATLEDQFLKKPIIQNPGRSFFA